MQQNEASLWLRRHPQALHCDVDEVLRRYEAEVRARAAERAWLAAKERAEAEAEEWTHHGGYHASDAWVANEVFPMFASELQAHPPAAELVGDGLPPPEEALGEVEPQARDVVTEFARAVAVDACNRTWEEIVRFTRSRPREWTRDGRLHREREWERMPAYPDAAVRVLHMLAEEFEAHAHAH